MSDNAVMSGKSQSINQSIKQSINIQVTSLLQVRIVFDGLITVKFQKKTFDLIKNSDNHTSTLCHVYSDEFFSQSSKNHLGS